MKGIKISSRYAKALLDLCKEKSQIDAVFADMKLVHATVIDCSDLRNLLISPIIKADTKISILNEVFVGEIGQITQSFIQLLAEKGREAYLVEIAESFIAQVKSHKKIVTAQVTTAVGLNEKTRASMTAMAKKLAGSEIELLERIDDSVIGGFVLQVGDKMIDTSVAASLRNLKRDFDDNPYIPEL